MATLTLYPDDERLRGNKRGWLNAYLITGLLLFVLIMLAGLTMRMNQARWITIHSDFFYQLLSMHGAGMIATMSLVTTAMMWYFLRKYVALSLWALVANYVLFLLGLLCIVVAVFIGNYGALWTFLYPLPVQGLTLWSDNTSALFMLGYVLIATGQLLFYLDAASAITRQYGNLAKAMCVGKLFGGTVDPDHPKAVIAGTGVLIANSLGLLAGAIALIMSLINVYFPSVKLDPLLTKTLIYWFGHMYANATIYMGVIAVYELLPRYTQRPYKVSRAFLWGWALTVVYVIVVFPHHLFMDFAEPRWFMVMGQIASWLGGFPVFLVTVYGALMNLYKADVRWSMPAKLLVLSMFGWAAGVIPAIADGTIHVNQVMHNTQWVPGHFHFYMLLGVMAMVLAFLYHLLGQRLGRKSDNVMDRLGFPLFAVGGIIFVFAFLMAGHDSVGRRMAQHWDAWLLSDHIGAVGASLVVLAMLWFALRAVQGLLRAEAKDVAPTAG